MTILLSFPGTHLLPMDTRLLSLAGNSIGSLDAVRRIVKLNGYVNCVPEFHDLPRVTDAASELLVDLFGDSGRHARTTVGVASLPKAVTVETELIAQFERE